MRQFKKKAGSEILGSNAMRHVLSNKKARSGDSWSQCRLALLNKKAGSDIL
jgi:hypothetical protein